MLEEDSRTEVARPSLGADRDDQLGRRCHVESRGLQVEKPGASRHGMPNLQSLLSPGLPVLGVALLGEASTELADLGTWLAPLQRSTANSERQERQALRSSKPRTTEVKKKIGALQVGQQTLTDLQGRRLGSSSRARDSAFRSDKSRNQRAAVSRDRVAETVWPAMRVSTLISGNSILTLPARTQRPRSSLQPRSTPPGRTSSSALPAESGRCGDRQRRQSSS